MSIFRVCVALCMGVLFLGSGCLGAEWQPQDPKEQLLEDVSASYPLARTWLLRNIRDNGLFYYIYTPKTQSYPNKNNALRQLMGSRVLAELAAQDATLLPLHEKNMAFIFSQWYQEEDGLGYVYYDDKSKLGANAMLLRTLVASPHADIYKEQATHVADGIVSLLDEQGAFRPWFREPTYTYDTERLLHFYSGEAIVALLEYYSATGEGAYLDAAVRAQDFYYEKYITQIDEQYYPAYVPWHTISLSHLYKITGDRRYAEGIFILNDRLLEMMDRTDHVGRFYSSSTPEFGTPHAASDGVYTEGLAYAYDIARDVQDTAHQEAYEHALVLAVRHLRSLQYTEEEVAKDVEPWRRMGAFRYSTTNASIRIDTTQHTMDAYTKILEVMKGDID